MTVSKQKKAETTPQRYHKKAVTKTIPSTEQKSLRLISWKLELGMDGTMMTAANIHQRYILLVILAHTVKRVTSGTCISVDRYMAIVQATRALKNKHKQLLCSKVVCISVWLLAMVLSLPELLYSEEVQGDEAKVCTMAYPSSFSRHIKIIVLSLKLTVGFCVPFLVMFFCYTLIVKTLLQARSFQKHKALKVIFTIITVFVVSQVPYNSILMMRTLEAASVTLRDCKTTVNLDIATQITQSLAFLHSSLNPLLYVFVGVQFRHDLFKILKKFGCMSRSQWARYVGSAWSSKRTSEILETKSSGTFTL
ncbi:hypothetical protein NDU88_004104 [Pleurodeles waltl]|uniref:G-protein coupled receptors family 1 profile domain-containing protein n=1 Tax=Pleurodeles waltl TaxID=8319 RepID=A0AAV7VJ97_PLEWA|nr:hypothetical protein NDU88_004104 [Pleurodeles waltl]